MRQNSSSTASGPPSPTGEGLTSLAPQVQHLFGSAETSRLPSANTSLAHKGKHHSASGGTSLSQSDTLSFLRRLVAVNTGRAFVKPLYSALGSCYAVGVVAYKRGVFLSDTGTYGFYIFIL